MTLVDYHDGSESSAYNRNNRFSLLIPSKEINKSILGPLKLASIEDSSSKNHQSISFYGQRVKQKKLNLNETLKFTPRNVKY